MDVQIEQRKSSSKKKLHWFGCKIKKKKNYTRRTTQKKLWRDILQLHRPTENPSGSEFRYSYQFILISNIVSFIGTYLFRA